MTRFKVIAAVISIVLIVAGLGCSSTPVEVSPTPQLDPPVEVPSVADTSTPQPTIAGSSGGSAEINAQGQAIFTGGGGCAACHAIEGISTGAVGPNLTYLGTDAATRKSGMSAEAYIEESIRDPEAFVAPGGIPGIMTAALTSGLSDDEVKALVDFLLAQK